MQIVPYPPAKMIQYKPEQTNHTHTQSSLCIEARKRQQPAQPNVQTACLEGDVGLETRVEQRDLDQVTVSQTTPIERTLLQTGYATLDSYLCPALWRQSQDGSQAAS